ncbi:DUF2589 domain-containing protein [Chryseotalea sanaruensis]|uniref:DUF2589 domain-containing protein n=1 Tax=Chryseotalea sanaruensis TaxID=2482724 RepID=A0A401U983_9BACT|nr:hypothetical protein [Chryseotalea sanaruensis]GCC51439.1 DUF2589 domain-containing protein [Chryseotalea sanaruensis]
MVKFDQFINVIHSAVQSANEALMQENLKLLETYFEDADESQEMKASLDEALDSIEKILQQTKPTREVLQQALKSFSGARKALENEDKPGTTKLAKSLRAKTVALQFPEQSSNGITMRNAHVPLISLVPVTMAQVSEVKFKTPLELQVENDELIISFSPTVSESKIENQHTVASIEITITPQASAAGLKALIKGYDNLLRSQIPN